MKNEETTYCLCHGMGVVESGIKTLEEAIRHGDVYARSWAAYEDDGYAIQVCPMVYSTQVFAGYRPGRAVAERRVNDMSEDPWQLQVPVHDFRESGPACSAWIKGERPELVVRADLGVVVTPYASDLYIEAQFKSMTIAFRAHCKAEAYLRREAEIYVETGGVVCTLCRTIEVKDDERPARVPMKKYVEPAYVSDKGERVPAQTYYMCWPCVVRDSRHAHVDRWGEDQNDTWGGE